MAASAICQEACELAARVVGPAERLCDAVEKSEICKVLPGHCHLVKDACSKVRALDPSSCPSSCQSDLRAACGAGLPVVMGELGLGSSACADKGCVASLCSLVLGGEGQ